mmetsp:Transcript_23272/g.42188  ORF Transcript_23272/g.42188 Transcript_23272/m.42188 type:complete len:109 (+) Transcript_23272:50-376(+)
MKNSILDNHSLRLQIRRGESEINKYNESITQYYSFIGIYTEADYCVRRQAYGHSRTCIDELSTAKSLSVVRTLKRTLHRTPFLELKSLLAPTSVFKISKTSAQNKKSS